jgi:hypothetical protein
MSNTIRNISATSTRTTSRILLRRSCTSRDYGPYAADLEAAGYLTRGRIGRRNQYTINPDSPFRHSAQEGHPVGPFLDLLAAAGDAAATRAESATPDGSQPTRLPEARQPRHRNPADVTGHTHGKVHKLPIAARRARAPAAGRDLAPIVLVRGRPHWPL